MKNTLNRGIIRTLIFKEGGVWYGVALEFNIVEAGDDPREVSLMLDEAIRGYLKSARKAKLTNSVLNQKTDSEYVKLWDSARMNQSIKSPIQIYSSGALSLSGLVG